MFACLEFTRGYHLVVARPLNCPSNLMLNFQFPSFLIAMLMLVVVQEVVDSFVYLASDQPWFLQLEVHTWEVGMDHRWAEACYTSGSRLAVAVHILYTSAGCRDN